MCSIALSKHICVNITTRTRACYTVISVLLAYISMFIMALSYNETIRLSTYNIGFGWIVRETVWGKELLILPYLDL